MYKRLNVLLWYAICFVGILFSNHHVSQAQQSNVEARFERGRFLYENGMYSSARDMFESITDEKFKVEADYYAACSAVRAGHADGENLVKQFVEQYRGHLLAKEAHLELGDYFYGIGDYKRAVSHYEIVKWSADAECLFRLGHSYFMLSRYEEANAVLMTLANSGGSEELDAAYLMGYMAFEGEDYQKAGEFSKKAYKSESYGEEARKITVACLYHESKYSDLIDFVDDELTDTEDPEVINFLADAQYVTKDYSNASTAYKKLLSKNNRYRTPSNYYKGGYSSYRVQELAQAEDWLKRAAITDDTVGAYASYYLGDIYSNQDNFNFAVTSFANTAKYETRLKEPALYRQARMLMQQSEYEKSINVLSKYNELYSNGTYQQKIDEMLSAAYAHTDNYQLAMGYIEALPELSENIKRIYQRITFVRGMSLFNQKKLKAASEMFPKSLIYNIDRQTTQQAFYWMGETLSLLGNEQDALFYYRSVDRYDQGLYLKSTYGLAYAYYNLGQYEDAADKFSLLEKGTDGLSLKHRLDVLHRLADCYFAMKNYKEGISYYKKAVTNGSKKKDKMYYQIGLLSRYIDNNGQAIDYFEKLVSEYPSSLHAEKAQFQLAEIAFKGGRHIESVDAYSHFILNHANSPLVPYALLNQAVSYDNDGKFASATANYTEIITRYPDHESAKSALLALQDKSTNGEFGKFDEYLAKYKKANPNSEALEKVEFDRARSLYYQEDYNKAIEAFNSFITSYKNSVLVTESIYLIADGYYRLENYSESLEALYEIEEAKDYSKYARVLYRMAEIEGRLGQTQKSNGHYYDLKKFSSSARYVIFSDQGLMQNHFVSAQYDSCIYYANKLLDNPDISFLTVSDANLFMGKALNQKGNRDEALEYLLSVVSSSPDERGAEANYVIGEIYKNSGQPDKALESLFSLAKNFNDYEYWVGLAYLLMSDIYVEKDEIFQAKATLTSLQENSSLSKIRLQAINKLSEIENDYEQKPAENDSL